MSTYHTCKSQEGSEAKDALEKNEPTVQVMEDGPIKTVIVIDTNSSPSWKPGCNGIAEISMRHHEQAGWLKIQAAETHLPDEPGKRIVTKEVFITLPANAVDEIFCMLTASRDNRQTPLASTVLSEAEDGGCP